MNFLRIAFWAITFLLYSIPEIHAIPLERKSNSTLTNLPAQPPRFGYKLVNAFPGLGLNQPVCITSAPGETNRLFVLEKTGNIIVITNLANPDRTVFMSLPVLSDSESGLLGLAFHPGFATNHYFFVFSTRSQSTSQGNGRHQRISRFQVSETNLNAGLPGTELTLINQYDSAGNHNGGDLHFGPDGYLYVSLGDEGAQYNGNLNSQNITKNFFSAILRIDVDKRPQNLLPNPHPANTTNYFVPADNPYIGLTSFNGKPIDPAKIRTEFYAIGFRNPWRMGFDSATGILYVGDVGQDFYEEVDVIRKGGNYGWAYYEGLHVAASLYPGQSTILRQPPADLVPPIQEYPHSGSGTGRGNAVIGGVVYRGNRIAQLYGAYIFADNGSGNVWMLRYSVSNTVPFQRITGAAGPSALGKDPRNGDVLVAQLNNNQIGRLDYDSTSVGSPLPPTLAETGAFSDLATLTPQDGIVPYSINVPFWSDNASKTRWFSVPNTNFHIGFAPEENWSFPAGSVWIKHFELELTNGVPESRRRLETRFIVRNNDGVYGITYRWDSPTNATLVGESGLDETLVLHDGPTTRTQLWHYPSRSECLGCHTSQGGFALGFNTPQLNRDQDYEGQRANQLEALSLAAYFEAPVSNRFVLRSLAEGTMEEASVEYRVRSYLAANCVQCHQPNGTAAATWDARIITPTPYAHIIDGPVNNDFGNPSNRVIVRGSLANSILFTRVAHLGLGHMPPLDTSVINTQAVALLSRWITNVLPGNPSYEQWQSNHFGNSNSALASPGADPDGDSANNYLEYLTETNPTNRNDAWRISSAMSSNTVQITFLQIANRGFEVQVTTNLASSNAWSPLNVPGNAPFFSITNRLNMVEDILSPNLPTFYRIRVFEP